MAEKGLFKPLNPSKYRGDLNRITYRSSWELMAFRWLDQNKDVSFWSSEETVIPYRCGTDGKEHRYFPDLKIWFQSGKVLIVEIKPFGQVKKPVKTKGKRTRTFLNEAFTYVKNQSKWRAAEEYCKQRGFIFDVWTESTLRRMGIPIPYK